MVGLINTPLEEVGKKKWKDAASVQTKATKRRALNKFLACRFIAASDKTGYGNVTVFFENENILGYDEFSNGVTTVYTALNDWKERDIHITMPASDGVSFTQSKDKEDKAAVSKNFLKARHYCYDEFGHIRVDMVCKPEDVEKRQ